VFEDAQEQYGSFLFEGVQGGCPEPVNAITMRDALMRRWPRHQLFVLYNATATVNDLFGGSTSQMQDVMEFRTLYEMGINPEAKRIMRRENRIRKTGGVKTTLQKEKALSISTKHTINAKGNTICENGSKIGNKVTIQQSTNGLGKGGGRKGEENQGTRYIIFRWKNGRVVI